MHWKRSCTVQSHLAVFTHCRLTKLFRLVIKTLSPVASRNERKQIEHRRNVLCSMILSTANVTQEIDSFSQL